jgi:hypothetical protein
MKKWKVYIDKELLEEKGAKKFKWCSFEDFDKLSPDMMELTGIYVKHSLFKFNSLEYDIYLIGENKYKNNLCCDFIDKDEL